jgi:Fe-S-cluster containining protein
MDVSGNFPKNSLTRFTNRLGGFSVWCNTIVKVNKVPTMPSCYMCGLCCQLFLINLNEEEYSSGEYITVFDDSEIFDDFSKAGECGANLLRQQKDGSCVYLKESKCTIHRRRPAVCRDFFCCGTEDKYKEMRNIVESARSRKS